MNTVDIICKKRDGYSLTNEELEYMINGYIHDAIEDYQMSAFLMAVYFQGMDDHELYSLTKIMMESGAIFDLTNVQGICVDKHSTGGVGDKTTLALAPMLAASGVCVAKMSGRGLAHTGGTLDKLESIPNFQIEMDQEAFINQLNAIQIAVIGQSDQLVLADKKIYALRDVTGTVPSIPLIASSIMSKKLAAGCEIILLDVKYGDGAFMKTKEEAQILAEQMIRLGALFNRNVKAEITNMNEPLGYAIGNILEVKEAIDTLQGKGPNDFKSLCLHSGATILQQANITPSFETAIHILEENISNGRALLKLKELVAFQKGDTHYIDNPDLFKKSLYQVPILAKQVGFIKEISCTKIGMLACSLGAGRTMKGDNIDYEVGIVLEKKVGQHVNIDDVLCIVHTNKPLDEAFIFDCQACFQFSEQEVVIEPLIYKTM